MDKIFLGGNTVVKWTDFVNSATGSAVTDATLTGTIKTLDGATLSTFVMSYEEGVEAYTGAFDTTVTTSSGGAIFSEGEEYYIEVFAERGSATGLKRRRVVAKYDSFD